MKHNNRCVRFYHWEVVLSRRNYRTIELERYREFKKGVRMAEQQYTKRIIDLETGEYKDYTDDLQITTLKDRIRKKEAIEGEKKKHLIRTYNADISHFIFFVYKYCKLNDKLDQKDMTRLIFLASYVNYKGYLMNDNHKPVIKSQLMKIMKLSKQSFYDFYNKLIDLDIINDKGEKIYLKKSLFFKGAVESNKKYIQGRSYIRLYIDTIRWLYNSVPVKQHKQLGIVFVLIPYINRWHNILCLNPNESILDDVEVMTLQKLAEILGYNASYIRQLKKELLKIKLENGSRLISFVEKEPGEEKKQLIINPAVIYGESEPEYAFKLMQKFF